MAIQKKSLIKTLKTAKKAKVAAAPIAKNEKGTSQKSPVMHYGKQYAQAYTRADFTRI
ncbi:MAG TPA: hypothetical protein VFO34_16600 [Candidatus Acidoferrales bacterium]|nr:hypothetical protein [Candidatus Acidoferrales bacterium]